MAAPLGNQFAIGGSGNKKLFETPEELEKYINEYFEWCENHPLIKKEVIKGGERAGEIIDIKVERPYTIEGLCLHLDIDRKTLLNYQKRKGYEDYFHVITRAKRKITQQYISLGLIDGFNANLVKFLLINNTEYKEKSEVENKGNIKISWKEEKTYDDNQLTDETE